MLKLKNRYDDEKLCNNPDKGWYVHYYDNGLGKYCTHYDLTDTLDDFPLMDHAYLRLAWGYLEPKEGEYHWDVLDRVIDPWVKAGKKISFRISCKELGWQLDGFCTPKWVFDAGAKYTRMTSSASNDGMTAASGQYIPVWDDEVYLEKVSNLAKAMAKPRAWIS